ncbi:MAG: Gfo/Idh/MocA family oxidoreductase [Alphaproteobacteria bacterium]|jgi:predicted dehydrogenase|nr:Gfo/Idh/MocA family oxidoreductase [Alphaproteobacteria bacterium]MBU1551349.1 Gfo/Idh/MocA family oxidoreductase [Alphaproteobacteria bacterium]MBU2336552.1 Gfo/Idh/MocA family oxidoreductase [Alphaproteobacteria bacterium]MBU2387966.1 Gfo/Idh/MocA family oxidoreductase [Alphaproteobacteria bacterium]
MKSIGIGLIGTGFMGKAHALAYRSVNAVFGDVPEVRLELLCDHPADRADAMARQFGFARATGNWREVVADPTVGIVCVTTPNKMHAEMAVAALEAGKHVHCEKPMALTLDEARQMQAAARRSGCRTIVGYNYLANPIYQHAKKLVHDGAIGRPVHFRGFVDEDYQADPETAWTWRATRADAGLGALGDLGCHLVSLMQGLMGPVATVVADIDTVHKTRAVEGSAERKPVENEDIASALIRFESGTTGLFSTSRSAWGRKSRIGWEVHGTAGMICFEQERMNELQIYQNTADKAMDGFRTILAGPAHPPYGSFCPAPGHQLGFKDLKTIEAWNFLKAIAGGGHAYPDFEAALEFEKVIHAIDRSAASKRLISIGEVPAEDT